MKRQATTRAVCTFLLATAAAFAADDAAAVKKLEAREWTVPSVGMEMKLIPAGTFTMGSPADEICRRDDEVQREVTISKPFYMAAFECRQGEFYRLMMPADYDYELWTCFRGPLHDGAAYTFRFPPEAKGGTPSPVGWTYPMDTITWDRAAEFCEKLTEIEKQAGRVPEGYVYRLPTEAEWEYACRAGTQGPYNFEGDFTNSAVLKKYIYDGDGGYYTFGVGNTVSKRKPNAWGLYDMHGNVWEWCQDWYGPYEAGKQSDPRGAASGKEKIVRGGSCAPWPIVEQAHPYQRCAARYSLRPNTDYLIVTGFRVALAPVAEKKE